MRCGLLQWHDFQPPQVLYGDYGESALEVVEAVSREVMLPLLSAPAEKAGLSPLLGRQVLDDLRTFVANGGQSTS